MTCTAFFIFIGDMIELVFRIIFYETFTTF